MRCRQGFRRLLESCGFSGRMPRLVACGGRSAAFDDFKTAHRAAARSDYVAMLIDSEDPVADVARTWDHLKNRDGWEKPAGADDEQALLMVTCMETWIVADREALRAHFGTRLEEGRLPPLVDLESRDRNSVQEALVNATSDCKNTYAKGKRSFEVVGRLAPATLRRLLRSFQRFEEVLKARL